MAGKLVLRVDVLQQVFEEIASGRGKVLSFPLLGDMLGYLCFRKDFLGFRDTLLSDWLQHAAQVRVEVGCHVYDTDIVSECVKVRVFNHKDPEGGNYIPYMQVTLLSWDFV